MQEHDCIKNITIQPGKGTTCSICGIPFVWIGTGYRPAGIIESEEEEEQVKAAERVFDVGRFTASLGDDSESTNHEKQLLRAAEGLPSVEETLPRRPGLVRSGLDLSMDE
jgi:hypothetical protein